MSASLAQGFGIKFGGGSFYFANERAALGEFAQVSPTEVEIGG
jgi:cephalosporin hydroxylase